MTFISVVDFYNQKNYAILYQSESYFFCKLSVDHLWNRILIFFQTDANI